MYPLPLLLLRHLNSFPKNYEQFGLELYLFFFLHLALIWLFYIKSKLFLKGTFSYCILVKLNGGREQLIHGCAGQEGALPGQISAPWTGTESWRG